MAGIEEFASLSRTFHSEEMNPNQQYSLAAYEDQFNQISDEILRQRYPQNSSDKDLSPPIQRLQIPKEFENTEDDQSMRKYLVPAIGIVSLVAENILSHPFVVMRRQCQVNPTLKRYHLQPITLIPRVFRLNQTQGISTLWKGLGSSLLIRGVSLAFDDVIHKITMWPKEISNKTTTVDFIKHLVLKGISIVLVLPFSAASLVETVQSDIASDKPGLFDVFKEGFYRINPWNLHSRTLPIWTLIGPAVSLGLSKYTFSLVVSGITSKIVRYRLDWAQTTGTEKIKDEEEIHEEVKLYSSLVSIITSEILFFPFETVLHRLQLQGTRTIIDNFDNGYSVVPIITKYDGFKDCYQSILRNEGITGLYKGFGALVLQIAVHIAVIKAAQWAILHLNDAFSTKPSNKIVQYYNLDREQRSNDTTISNSLSSLDAHDVDIIES